MTDDNGSEMTKAEQAKKAARKAVDEVTGQAEEAMKRPFDKFVEHERQALREAGKAIEALLPEKFWTHGRRALEEFSSGVQVLADAVIAELEKVSKHIEKDAEDAGRPSTTGPTKVKVEVE
ncbi:MAG: hypothetical protein ACUVSX_16065 [Aggregatilineales bacterium]